MDALRPNMPLDYAPAGDLPCRPQRLAAASNFLGIGGIVWGFMTNIVAGFLRMGTAKSILIDGSIVFVCVAPSIFAVAFGMKAIIDWRRSRRLGRDLSLSVIGIVAGAGWIICLTTFFVKEILLSPIPYWDSI